MTGSPFRARLTATALTAGALLMQEVVVGRLLSVVTWYSLGYVALTLGLLGMTVGALVVHLRPAWFTPERLGQSVAVGLLLACALTVLAAVWTTRMPVSFNVAAFGQSLMSLLVVSVLIALPFAAGGAALAALLTRAERPGLVYAADLAGSAVGALLAAPALEWLGAPRALVAAALCFALAMLVLAPSVRGRVEALVVAAMLCAPLLWPGALDVRWMKDTYYPPEPQPVAQGWNSMSYVRAEPFELARPFYWGALSDAPQEPMPQSMIRIDGEAGTVAYSFEDVRTLDGLRFDVTSAAHWLRPEGKALVVGVGGGRDVATALLFRHDDVTAVEVNPLLVSFLTGPLANISPVARQPGVSLHVEDGRSWLASQPARFDTIVASLVDTWAATGAGAMTLSENSLYTLEAWLLFLDKLTPGGVVSFSRWYEPGRPLEAGRLVGLAASALRARGVTEPESHLALVASGRVVTLLASSAPLSPADTAVLAEREASGGLTVLLAPGRTPADPFLGEIVRAPDVAALATLSERAGVDLTPPTDDRPFFFLQVPAKAFLSPQKVRELLERGGGMLFGNVVAVGAVATAFLLAAVLAALWVLVPLSRRKGALAGLSPGGRALVLGWFAALGMGFMLFEIATAQRLHLLLGNPTWALALTLAPATLFAGLGSALSERLAPSRVWAVAAGAAVLLCAWALVPGGLLTGVMEKPWMVRALSSVLLAGTPALLLGFFFPSGLRRVLQVAPAGAAWCWGINGVTSVLGSGAAVFLSVAHGTRVTLLVAAAVYVTVALLARALFRLEPARTFQDQGGQGTGGSGSVDELEVRENAA